jgi:hypothetical protein
MSSRSHGVGIHPITCPWCFESVEILLESDSEAGEWVEDCPVCCHPIALEAVDNGDGSYRLCAERSH